MSRALWKPMRQSLCDVQTVHICEWHVNYFMFCTFFISFSIMVSCERVCVLTRACHRLCFLKRLTKDSHKHVRCHRHHKRHAEAVFATFLLVLASCYAPAGLIFSLLTLAGVTLHGRPDGFTDTRRHVSSITHLLNHVLLFFLGKYLYSVFALFFTA